MTSVGSLGRVETPRLVCERLRVEHAPEVARLFRDPRVAEWLWFREASPSEQEVVENTLEKERHWDRYGFGLWLMEKTGFQFEREITHSERTCSTAAVAVTLGSTIPFL